jgi:lipopolysaccharide transport system permease protein
MENFVVFLVCGKIPFLWFSKSVTNSSQSILANRGIINQTAINKAFFPLLVVFQDSVKQIFVFLFMFVFLGWSGFFPSIEWLGLIPIVATQLLLIIACALIAAAIVPFIPDFRYIIGTGMIMLMLGSGIFYSYDQVILPEHRAYFLMNPLANLFKNYRQVLMHGEWPDWQALAVISLLSAGVIYLMLRVYRRADTAFARLVVQ